MVSSGASPEISCAAHVSGVTGEPERLLYLAASARESPCERQWVPGRANARPPSADARSLWDSQDGQLLKREDLVCGRHRGRGSSASPAAWPCADGGMSAPCGCASTSADYPQSPSPAVCRVSNKSRVCGRSDIRAHTNRLADHRRVAGTLFMACRGGAMSSRQTRSVVVEAWWMAGNPDALPQGSCIIAITATSIGPRSIKRCWPGAGSSPV
jgi:hypothetical protein